MLRAVLIERLVLIALAVAICVGSTGCASSAEREKRADQDPYELGRLAAREAIERGEPTIWVFGLFPPAGTDPDTGLPFKAAASCVVPGGLPRMIAGHNDEIRAWLRSDGPRRHEDTEIRPKEAGS